MQRSFKYCGSCKELHDLSNWPALCMSAPPKRSDLKAPMLLRDSMEPVQSMLDGKMYDSKAALRATYKAAGVVETGSELPKPRPKYKTDRKAIKAAVRRAASKVGFSA